MPFRLNDSKPAEEDPVTLDSGLGARPSPEPVPVGSEPLAPWIGGALVVAVCILVIGDSEVGGAAWFLSVLVLYAVLTAGLLIAHRTRRRHAIATAEDRARPAAEELQIGAGSDRKARPGDAVGTVFLETMVLRTAAVQELLAHSIEASPPGPAVAELSAMAEDTAALNDLLQSSIEEPPSAVEMARLHSLCTLWDTNMERVEDLCAGADHDFHRRWRARHLPILLDPSVADGAEGQALPYRQNSSAGRAPGRNR